MGQFLVLDAMRSFRVGAKSLATILFVVLVVSFEPHDIAVSLESEDVGSDSVEEPTIMAYHDGASSEVEERFLKCSERVYVEIVRWLVEKDNVSTCAKHLRHMYTIAFSSREPAH